MGYLLQAQCNSCGFSQQINFGSGRASFGSVVMVPAIKDGQLVVVNKLDPEQSDVELYSDDHMHAPLEDELMGKWNHGSTWIAKRQNLCPKCSEMTMNFNFSGIYD